MPQPLAAPDSNNAASFSDPNFVLPEESAAARSADGKGKARAEAADKPESLPADIVKEASSMVSRFRSEAASRMATVRQAEDAADEALLRFGTNIRSFLREAVTVSAPQDGGKEAEVLFETNDAEGRRVFHSSRGEAQLHAIHSRLESFAKDPEGEEWVAWVEGFDVEKETDRIAADLERYEELRRAMEKLVPEKVEYKDFWRRYYFLRMVVEEEEKRRKEVLKGECKVVTLVWTLADEMQVLSPITMRKLAGVTMMRTTSPLRPLAALLSLVLRTRRPRMMPHPARAPRR